MVIKKLVGNSIGQARVVEIYLPEVPLAKYNAIGQAGADFRRGFPEASDEEIRILESITPFDIVQ
jgi:hypothetical protein